ncbi:hypothetical protein EDB81DRAFT_706042 [Dactylonectria macrodidyma]|uniref:Uncharacterized protein n=1 Tax=Dactylonectria macrodidyma TaxID=307937 RepID=A0A9P9FSJ4_9HYPO|nr:hypothetical protein EDB81DRAFT_706042 [Dactylonectria macrodidyma]
MPPIRTAKTNDSSAIQNPIALLPKKRLLKPITTGVKDAHFYNSERDWDGKYHRVIGTSTRNITLGSDFVLTDDHIDDLLVLAKPVLQKIVKFIFTYKDVSYGAKNTAKDLTNEAVIRLAQACPSLKIVQLPGTHLNDDGLLGLLKNCDKLTIVELTGTSGTKREKSSGKALDELREHPEWVPKLKQLSLEEKEDNKLFMKAMRALTKERIGLTVVLVTRNEYKKWGDWELEERRETYKKGRKQSRW